ncbi:MAG: VOC family protein [Actinobacteria bacterium]|nr:MAG: VOC family protein [Actinomycetota bacterium]
MSRRFQITFDANDTDRLARFWAEVLGYVLQPPPEGFDSWEAFAVQMGIPEEDYDRFGAVVDPDGSGQRVLFQRVPEGKTAKNRMHLDIRITERDMSVEEQRRIIDAEAERLVALGATRGADHTEMGMTHTVMHDPEGNEFCLT